MRVTVAGEGNGRAFVPEGSSSVLKLAAQAEADGLDEEERSRMIQAGMKAAAQVVQADAKRRVRVRTGNLRRHIKVEAPRTVRVYRSQRRFDEVQADFARIRVTAHHWYVVEFGRKAGPEYRAGGQFGIGQYDYPPAPPYPYLNPALETTQKEQFERCIVRARNTWQNIADRKRRG